MFNNIFLETFSVSVNKKKRFVAVFFGDFLGHKFYENTGRFYSKSGSKETTVYVLLFFQHTSLTYTREGGMNE